MKDKLEMISNLFEGKEIRSVWDSDKEDYYFSVVDVIEALTDSTNPRNYWNMLKKRMDEEEIAYFQSRSGKPKHRLRRLNEITARFDDHRK